LDRWNRFARSALSRRPIARAFRRALAHGTANPARSGAAAVMDLIPLSGAVSHTPYARSDTAPPPVAQRPIAITHGVSTGYFGTFSIPLLAGRDIQATDDSIIPSGSDQSVRRPSALPRDRIQSANIASGRNHTAPAR
jgi:hypothetical protein